MPVLFITVLVFDVLDENVVIINEDTLKYMDVIYS